MGASRHYGTLGRQIMAAGDEYFEDLLKFIVQYSGDRNTAENVFYASCAGAHGATESNLVSLATSVHGWWGEYLMPLMSSAVSLQTVLCADWTDAEGLTGEYTAGVAGGLTGAPLTSQVCALINETSLMRYRGGRGRIYLPPPDVTKVETDQTWTGAFVADLATAITTVLNDINTLEIGVDLLTAVLYHRSGNKVVAQGYEDIVEVSASSIPGTQRRRVRRVGHLR
jgi:hypothetical protein